MAEHPDDPILIVDAHPHVRETLSDTLADRGYAVHAVESIGEAVGGQPDQCGRSEQPPGACNGGEIAHMHRIGSCLDGQFDMDVGIGGCKGRKLQSDQYLGGYARQIRANRARRALTVNAQAVLGTTTYY